MAARKRWRRQNRRPMDSAFDAPDAAGGAGTDPAAPAPLSAVRSFVLRGGRLGPGQRRALETVGPRFIVPFSAAPPDWDAVFGRRALRVVEIGFGMGDATAAAAAARPDVDFIGVEVHAPGVGALLQRIDERGLANVRIVRDDAVRVVDAMLAPGSLAAVHVWFPDPWPKTRHHKRRLIQPAFVGRLAERLAASGRLHCATDWQPYAEQMLAVLRAEPRLVNAAASGGYSERPASRPSTKFERRGLARGHGVWDLVFVRRGAVPQAQPGA